MKYLYLSLLLPFISCTTITKIDLIRAKNTSKIFTDGKPVLISKKENSKVALLLSKTRLANGTNLYAFMKFHNLSDKPANLNPKNINVLRKSKKDFLHVFSYAELINQVNKSRRNYAIFSIISMVLGTMSDGYSSHSGSYTSNYGNSYSYTGRSYSSASARIESDRRHDDIDRRLASYDKQEKNLQDIVLKRNTLMPNKKVSGYIVINMPKLEINKDYFKIVTHFAGDRHVFFIKQSMIN